MAHGDDIVAYNETMPVFPDGTPLWHRILCVLGYHKREVRRAGKNHRGGGGVPLGSMRLRDQCGRCNRLLNDPSIPKAIADVLAPIPKDNNR